MVLGRPACPLLESFGEWQEDSEGLGHEGEKVDRTEMRVEENGFGGGGYDGEIKKGEWLLWCGGLVGRQGPQLRGR